MSDSIEIIQTVISESMEAIIRTNNKDDFISLLKFLKTMNFEVETKNEFKISENQTGKIEPMSIEEFYQRNQQYQIEIATGKLITQNRVKQHLINKSK